MKLSCIQNCWTQNATSELDADKWENKKVKGWNSECVVHFLADFFAFMAQLLLTV